jgi:carbon-monoxide dehydrogenase medium subunit
MIALDFDYQRPATLEEAVRLLRNSRDAKVLAGGHSLLPLIKLGLAQPRTLVDIGRLAELRDIRATDGEIAIGALVTHQTVCDDETIRTRLTALAEAAESVGDLQVRSRGTIGGSLAHADPAADDPAPVLAFDATLRAVGPRGERTIKATEFFTGAFETALAPDEILAEIRIPLSSGRTGSAYEWFPHPASHFAIAGVAVVVTLADGRVGRAAIGVTGAAASPYRASAAERALAGTMGDPQAIVAAAAKAAEGITALADLVASAEFRVHLVEVHARRAITRALERARAS